MYRAGNSCYRPVLYAVQYPFITSTDQNPECGKFLEESEESPVDGDIVR